MNYLKEILNRGILFILLAAVACFLPQAAGAECDCEKDTAIPPFLAEGATPNLLLMIDNSASMYDSVYTDTTTASNGVDDDADGVVDDAGESSLCFDDTFDSDTAYEGYFDKETWYAYNLPLESNGLDDDGDGDIDEGEEATRFEISENGACGDAAGTWSVYSNDDYVCMATTVSTETGEDLDGNAVTYDVYNAKAFKAKGNFLNWASASRFDIQKKILTGGKYDDATGLMESEGRGCSGNRFIRQTTVYAADETEYKLVLGVRADDDKNDTIDTTLIDIFPPSTVGFSTDKCQAAIDYMMGDPSGFGQVKNLIIECMEYVDIYEHHRQEGEHDKQALIHSLHDCWYLDKKGDWPSGGAQGFNFEKWCAEIYTRDDPRKIYSNDPAYVCSGDSTDDDDEGGYIGECWAPAGICDEVSCEDYDGAFGDGIECGADGNVSQCLEWVPATYYTSGSKAGQQKTEAYCKKDEWETAQICTGGAETEGWKYSDSTSPTLDECITAARERFCGVLQAGEVVDPSDLEMTTGETWNLPAMLMARGAAGQLGVPMYTAKGFLETEAAPSGLLQEFSSDIRIGAMAFNYDGSDSECYMPEPHVKYDCDDPNNRDGAVVLQPIGSDYETPTHTDYLVAVINDTKANTWTPLAEAMYTAIGYYTRKTDMELNPGLDFSTWDAPITEFCQSNNVLFVTDGSSTADLNPDVIALADQVTAMDPSENDGDSSTGCGDLYGSSYFDDLTYYAKRGDIFDGSPYTFEETPENINTWIVYTGDTNDTGDECAAYALMQNAVANGGPNAVSSPGTDEVLLGGDYDELSQALRDAFESILKRAAAGSAASVISATRSGEGAVYQAIFWPAKTGPEIDNVQLPDVIWTGEVHALLMDAEGNLFEDTYPDRTLDTAVDTRVVFYFDEQRDETVACYEGLDDAGVCTGEVKNLDQVKYLWSAAEWLAGISDTDIGSNRDYYVSNEQQRYIYTWNDIDNDGVVDAAEWIPFEADTDWSALDVSGAVELRGEVVRDFGVDTDAEVDAIVSWIRGKDADGLRTRELDKPENFDVTVSVDDTITWRLGDVIYSTPTSVARPEENYHLVYRDDSYIDFVMKYKNRRHMIYFGANDGMIHAVNGGFYSAADHKFYLAYEGPDGDGLYQYTDSATAPALGAEMWAYVPYNLQPQLKCLTDPNYSHRYYVDLKPRMFDVQIFDVDDDHPNGWGTIMVAGMRFGGSSVDADTAGDARKFVSAYSIFDITNPEAPPELLGELTYDAGASAHMGYTTLVPVVVPMKESTTVGEEIVSETNWYLVLGSGPLVLDDSGNWVYETALEGISNQTAKVAVFPLDKLTSGDRVFRIPNAAPADEDTPGIFTLVDTGGTAVVGFVSDPISVDFDLDMDYRADAIYFGTVEGDWDGWGGRLYRLVTKADGGMTDPSDWELKEMLNPERPVTAAPMAGWDGENFWVYFGTGRFFDEKDKSNNSSNDQENYYGLKEPVDCEDDTFEWPTLTTASLFPVGSIRVAEGIDPATAELSCYDYDLLTETYSVDATGACLPDGVTTFSDLDTYVAGVGCAENEESVLEHTGEAGWVHALDLERERNLGQATLLGGLLTFTTYQPFDDLCRLEGEAFLYALYYRTGTAWHESVFDSGGTDPVEYKKDLGRGLATTPNLHVGKEEGGTAFAQTSTGAIVEIEQPNMPIKEVKTGRMYWRTD